MSTKESKQLCLEFFFGVIPNPILPCRDDSNCLRSLSAFDQKPINGKMRCPVIFKNNCTNYSSDQCVATEEDKSQEKHSKLKIQYIENYLLPIDKTNQKDEAIKKYKSIKVKCLQSIDSLKLICEKEGLLFNDFSESNSSSVFEIDLICDHKIEEGEKYFFIKWKNYPLSTNTWEPEYHLNGCREAIKYYLAIQKPDFKLSKNLLEYFIKDLTTRKPYDVLTLTKLCALATSSTESYVDSLKLNTFQLRRKVREILSFHYGKICKISNKLVELMKLSEKRKLMLINLQEWEDAINALNTTSYIRVENNVDFETAPTDFHFVHDYINRAVSIPEEPVAFCRCSDCFNEKKDCCPHDSEGEFAYSKHRRLLLKPGYPIYECNKLCACDSTCINRVVQHGQKVKVSIFRTSNGCGWGLKSLEPIEKGQFVLEYLGEIITSEEAEIRGREYDYIGRSYLFDLDYSTENCNYTVDARIYGNAAHFINHSCDPNLHVFAVWINQPDPNLPRLAFFAKRKIRRGEELTFDYKMVKKDRFSLEEPLPENERIPCLCNSRNCRKFLF